MTDASAYQSGITVLPTATDSASAKIVIRSPQVILVNGVPYELGYSKKCSICKCPWRMEIEQMLLPGTPPRVIEETLYAMYGEDHPQMEHVNRRSILNHSLTHSPVRQVVGQRVAKRYLEEIGRNFEEIEDTVVDRNLLGRQVMNIAYAKLLSGDIEPTLADAATFAKMEMAEEATADTRTQGQLFARATTLMMEVIRQELSEATYDRIMMKLAVNSELKAIFAQARAIEAQASELANA
jgi:hypothetical protein